MKVQFLGLEQLATQAKLLHRPTLVMTPSVKAARWAVTSRALDRGFKVQSAPLPLPQLAPDRIRIIEWDLLGPRHRRALASQLTTISQEHKLHTICVIASAPTTREARAALAQLPVTEAYRLKRS